MGEQDKIKYWPVLHLILKYFKVFLLILFPLVALGAEGIKHFTNGICVMCIVTAVQCTWQVIIHITLTNTDFHTSDLQDWQQERFLPLFTWCNFVSPLLGLKVNDHIPL